MILYHGSNTEIVKINLDKCKPYKDFGRGFYLTEIYSQAERMANRTASIYGGSPVVTKFEFDESAFSRLSVKQFEAPCAEWALFVMANRSKENRHPIHTYDLVIGPVADDSMSMLFRKFGDGIINLDELVRDMQYKEFSSQYLFHTEEAIKYLKRYE